MKKFLSFTAVASMTMCAVAQDKVVEITPLDKQGFIGKEMTTDGHFYAVTGRSKKDVTIRSYDSDLNLAYEKTMQTAYEGLPAFFGRGMNDSPVYYDLFASKTGKYAIAADDLTLLDRSGNATKLNFTKKDESGEIDSYFYFISDEYICYLGKKPTTGKGKKKIVDDNIYMFRRSLADQSTKLIELSIPDIETTQDKVEFGLHSFDNDGFYIINKQLDIANAVDVYNIINYDYDGKLISNKTLKVKLDGKFFAASKCGFGSSTIHYGSNFTTHRLGDNSTGNVYIDKGKREYYVFGVYTNVKDKDLYNARNNGFYVNKFDFDGNLIWQSQNEITDKDYNKNSVSYFTKMSFFKLKNNEVGIRISNSKHNYAHMFLLKSSDGKVTKSQKNDFKVSQIELNGIRGGSFPTGYSNKDLFGTSNLDVDCFFAAFASTKVSDFFTSVKSMKNNYNSYVLENAVYILEENVQTNKFRIMKFDW